MANLLATYGSAARVAHRPAAAGHGRFSRGVLGRHQGRRRAGVPQHAADDRAVRLHPRRQPRARRCSSRRRCCPWCSRSWGSCRSSSTSSWRAARRRRSRSRCAASCSSSRAEFQAADTCCDETAFWLYSSGSTGMPKGVRHVHSSPMETARLTGQQCLGMREDDLVFSAAKLFFAYGLGNAMSFPMSVGATAVLLPERPTPEVVFRTLKQYQPTLFFGVPTLYAAHAGLPAGHARERLAAPAPVRLGRRGAARRGRQGLPRQVRRRRARRRRLHRDAAPVRLQQPERR